MAKNPAFPFYASDYLVDTLRWSRGMKSLHVDLMAESWANKKLKDDNGFPEGLNAEDKKLWAKIVHKWKLVDGYWINEKLEECRVAKENFIKRQSDKGKKSAEARRQSQPELNHGSTTVQPLEDEKEEFKYQYKESGIETLKDSEYWTALVLQGNDPTFLNMIRNAGIILNGKLDRLARDHLGKSARYNWHEKQTTQQAFRHSLLNYIAENLNKQVNEPTTRKNGTAGPERGKDYSEQL